MTLQYRIGSLRCCGFSRSSNLRAAAHCRARWKLAHYYLRDFEVTSYFGDNFGAIETSIHKCFMLLLFFIVIFFCGFWNYCHVDLRLRKFVSFLNLWARISWNPGELLSSSDLKSDLFWQCVPDQHECTIDLDSILLLGGRFLRPLQHRLLRLHRLLHPHQLQCHWPHGVDGACGGGGLDRCTDWLLGGSFLNK